MFRGQVTTSYRYTYSVAVRRIAPGPAARRCRSRRARGWGRRDRRRRASGAGQGRSDSLAHVAHRQHLQKGEKAAWMVLYDSCFVSYAEEAGMDMILVGDSMGMIVYGFDGTVPVTMEMSIDHCKGVRKGAPNTYLTPTCLPSSGLPPPSPRPSSRSPRATSSSPH